MKRCPRCGRTYDDIWQVCLEDGEPIVDCRDIPESPEVEHLKNKARNEVYRKRSGEVKTLLRLSLFFAFSALFIVYKTTGNPFRDNPLSASGTVKKILYNAGTLTGMLLAGAVMAIPVWFLWKRFRGD